MTPTPMTTRPGEPDDPGLRDRYAHDAWVAREAHRVEAARAAAEAPASRTPSGPIRVIAAIVTVVLVVAAGIALVGPMLKQSETSEQALPAVTALELSGHVGEVRIRAAEPGEAPKAVTTSTWGLWRPSTSVGTRDGVAQLKSSCSARAVGAICSTDWLVVVPAGTDVSVESGVGSIDVEEVSGDIDVEAGVGEVSITGAASDRVSVEMGVGEVVYEAVEPPRAVDLTLGVGDVRVGVPSSVGYRVDTTGASEARNTIGHDPASERSIRVEAGVGSVSIDPS
ncbi:hypothetical protein [Janibacter sp. GS2]|uniref:hypothetical protein n=1 Tax=Janibacter sp. GS2 TaxID=3442646 RepID=UPI003EB8C4FF